MNDDDDADADAAAAAADPAGSFPDECGRGVLQISARSKTLMK